VVRDLSYIVHQRHCERVHQGAGHGGEEHRQQRQEAWPGAAESLQSGEHVAGAGRKFGVHIGEFPHSHCYSTTNPTQSHPNDGTIVDANSLFLWKPVDGRTSSSIFFSFTFQQTKHQREKTEKANMWVRLASKANTSAN
jgi:hypothetical protein